MSRPVLGGTDVDLAALFRPVASSVWVITSADPQRPVGFTAVSLVSVSSDPPLVSFNLSTTSSSRDVVESSDRLAAHLLADDQEHLARRFAGDRDRRFVEDGHWSWCEGGLPDLPDALVRLVLEPRSFTPAGDSIVVVSEIVGARHQTGSPLLHHDRAYLPAPRRLSVKEGAA